MALEDYSSADKKASVLRLAATARASVYMTLLKRGIQPENIDETIAALGDVGAELNADDVVDNAFRARSDKATPFNQGRFGDGSIGVYYSALEGYTCEKELEHHLGFELAELREKKFPHGLSYGLIACTYFGNTVDFRGEALNHPELVSKTSTGYPFCQSLALHAVRNGVDGFFTPSARCEGGTCVPVFRRATLSRAKLRGGVTFTVDSEGVKAYRH